MKFGIRDAAEGLFSPAFAAVLCVLAFALGCLAFALGHSISALADDEQAPAVPALSSSDAEPVESARYEKGEVVYSTLDARGGMIAAYVVNQFDVKVPGRIVDYGAYDSVKNLSTQDALVREKGATVFDVVDSGVFYYEGDSTSLDLPWSVSIEYWLDGERYADPADLGGKSGQLEIRLRTTQNPQVNSAFYESFLQQVTFTLPGDSCTDIQADGATVASAGKDRTVAFAVLPGHDADCTVRANVRDFCMDGIQIAALPYESAISMPDTSSMTSGFEQLVTAVGLLKGGAAELSAGTDQLADGTTLLSDGLAQFDTAQIEEYTGRVLELIGLLPGMMEGVDVSEESIQQVAAQLAAIADLVEGIGGLDGETRQRIQELMEALGIDPNLDFGTAAVLLRGLSQGLSDNAADMVRLVNELSDPDDVAKIQQQVNGISEGVVGLKEGVLQLSGGARQLADGMQAYSDGVSELYGGVSELPGMVSSEISKMMDEYSFPEFVPQSFVSSRNAQMKSVQFVIQSEGIELPKAKAAVDDGEGKSEGFLDRLLALFK